MNINEWLLFASALFVMVITPGPGVMACVSKSLVSGPRDALFVILGIMTGDLVFLTMAFFGLAAVAAALGNFFVIVKYCGAAYLIWLGIQAWRSKSGAKVNGRHSGSGPKSSYVAGLTVTLGNPKAIVFYLSILPAFIDLTRSGPLTFVITIATVLGVLAAVLVGYVLASALIRGFLRSEAAQQRLRRVSGTVMITAGVTVAVRD